MALNYIAVAALSVALAGFPSLGFPPGNAPDGGDGKAKELTVEKSLCGGGYLGVMIDDVTKDETAKLGLPEERGARITKVMPESPAAKVGLQENDVIVKWNDTPVESAMQLGRLSQETPAGRTVNLTVIRGGQTLQLKPELAKRDQNFFRFESDGDDVRMFEGKDGAFDVRIDEEDLKREIEDAKKEIEDSVKDMEDSKREIEESAKELSALPKRLKGFHMEMGRMHRGLEGFMGARPNIQITMADSRFGAQVQNMSPALSKSFGVGEGKTAALVSDVDENSPAGKAGLRAGDVIVSIDGKPVQSPQDVMNVVNSKQGSVPVRILRDKTEQTVNVDLGKPDDKVKEGKPESDASVGGWGSALGLGSVSMGKATRSGSVNVFTVPGTSHSSCTVIVRGGCCSKMKAPKAPLPPAPPAAPDAPAPPAPPAQPMKAPTML